MILHGLTITNWKNLGRLELTDLDHPLVVLYGPNGTGKSSIVAALRSCLFDFDHNSTAAVIREAVPWFTKRTPEVAVEFETGGERYRLSKRFSTLKDGGAELERWSGGGWTVLVRDKEASRDARRLLGTDKSDEGLNELLWLAQGETRLPDSTQLNAPLQKRLEEVLGTLLTSRDWDFLQALRKSADTYFTARTQQARKNSPVSDLERQQDACEQQVEALRRKVRAAEALVRDFESLEEEIARERQNVVESEREVARRREKRQATHARRLEHQEARLRFEAAEREHRRAAEALAVFSERKQELAALEHEILRIEAAVRFTDETQTRLAGELAEVVRQLIDDVAEEGLTLSEVRTS
jgi:DNA repair exonuclease SbcCD ATPase subunit